LVFLEKVENPVIEKCPGDWGKSFVELPNAIQFL